VVALCDCFMGNEEEGEGGRRRGRRGGRGERRERGETSICCLSHALFFLLAPFRQARFFVHSPHTLVCLFEAAISWMVW